jgi:hypothetical protein
MSVKDPGCQEGNDDGDENRQRDQDFAHWLRTTDYTDFTDDICGVVILSGAKNL